jgi:t-SNARE complex subunit (syntaxin)
VSTFFFSFTWPFVSRADPYQHSYEQTEKAVVSARNARRGRWICFWIAFIVIIIIVVVVLVELKPWQTKKN